jgi:hypothetical protein
MKGGKEMEISKIKNTLKSGKEPVIFKELEIAADEIIEVLKKHNFSLTLIDYVFDSVKEKLNDKPLWEETAQEVPVQERFNEEKIEFLTDAVLRKIAKELVKYSTELSQHINIETIMHDS